MPLLSPSIFQIVCFPGVKSLTTSFSPMISLNPPSSDATRVIPGLMAITAGQVSLVPQISPSLNISRMLKDVASLLKLLRARRRSPWFAARSSSMVCMNISESVSPWTVWPLFARKPKIPLGMLAEPLWTSAKLPSQDLNGCVFFCLTSPWLGHLLWPSAAVAPSASILGSLSLRNLVGLSGLLKTWTRFSPSEVRQAIPAPCDPRPSWLLAILAAIMAALIGPYCSCVFAALIPHMDSPLSYFDDEGLDVALSDLDPEPVDVSPRLFDAHRQPAVVAV